MRPPTRKPTPSGVAIHRPWKNFFRAAVAVAGVLAALVVYLFIVVDDEGDLAVLDRLSTAAGSIDDPVPAYEPGLVGPDWVMNPSALDARGEALAQSNPRLEESGDDGFYAAVSITVTRVAEGDASPLELDFALIGPDGSETPPVDPACNLLASVPEVRAEQSLSIAPCWSFPEGADLNGHHLRVTAPGGEETYFDVEAEPAPIN